MLSYAPHRRRLDPTRSGYVSKGSVQSMGGEIEYYVNCNFYPDGGLGEVFVKIAKPGSDLSGWVCAWATTVSIALQHGVPWEVLRGKFLGQEFGGLTGTPSLLHAVAETIDGINCVNRAFIRRAAKAENPSVLVVYDK